METLQQKISRFGQTKLAKSLRVSQPQVSHWSTGIKPVPIKYALAIENLTHGFITRKDVRPNDWPEIWPDLIDKAKQ